jgi:hypothetical protein
LLTFKNFRRGNPLHPMGTNDFLSHLAGFLAPAAFLALALPVASRVALRRDSRQAPLWLQAALVFVAGALLLAAGLWWFGRDGKVATYAALVIVTASTQWLALRAWR